MKIGADEMLKTLYNLKKCLNHSLIVGTKLISDDYKLKKAIEDFGELEKVNPIFAKIKKLCDEIFSSQNVNDKILETLSLVDAILYTQGKNEVALDKFTEIRKKKKDFCNIPYSLKTNLNCENFSDYVKKNPSFINTSFFWKHFNLLNDKKNLLKGDIKLPYGWTKIESGKFKDCKNITSISIPNSVKSIEWGAFNNCTSLSSVSMTDSVTSIESNAFRNCTNLSSVVIPKFVTMIGNGAFAHCINLSSVVIPDSVIDIDYQAFLNCNIENLNHNYLKIENGTVVGNNGLFLYCRTSQNSSISVPKNIELIKSFAFANSKMLTSISLPSSLKTIDIYAFRDCLNLKEVKFEGTKEEWEKIEIENGNECLVNANIIFEK